MNHPAIRLGALALAFSVVGIWALRSEPTAGPLLVVPGPASDANSVPEQQFTSGDPGHPHGPFDDDAETSPVESEPRDPAELSETTDRRRHHVRQLIRRLRPQQPAPAIEVWVEQFGHLSDDDISFLINQSTLSGEAGSADAVFSASHIELPGAIPGGSPSVAETSGSDPRLDVVRTNLANTMTVGYRDQLVLNVLSAGDTPDPRQCSLWRLSAGEALQTYDPLHVALRTPGRLFFQLADGRLTRNGMFSRLDNGQLGLPAGETFVALRDSPVLPAGLHAEILPDGHVMADGHSHPLGRVRVVSVSRGDELSSGDGVYFRTRGTVQPAQQFELQSGAVELSNVDAGRNRQVLRALRNPPEDAAQH